MYGRDGRRGERREQPLVGRQVGRLAAVDQRRQHHERAAVAAAGTQRDAQQPGRRGHLGPAALLLGEDDGLLEHADRVGRAAVEGRTLAGREQPGQIGRALGIYVHAASGEFVARVIDRRPALPRRLKTQPLLDQLDRVRHVPAERGSRPAGPRATSRRHRAGSTRPERSPARRPSWAGSPVRAQRRPQEEHGRTHPAYGSRQRAPGAPRRRGCGWRSPARPARRRARAAAGRGSRRGRRRAAPARVRAGPAAAGPQRGQRALGQQVLDVDPLAGRLPAFPDAVQHRRHQAVPGRRHPGVAQRPPDGRGDRGRVERHRGPGQPTDVGAAARHRRGPVRRRPVLEPVPARIARRGSFRSPAAPPLPAAPRPRSAGASTCSRSTSASVNAPMRCRTCARWGRGRTAGPRSEASPARPRAGGPQQPRCTRLGGRQLGGNHPADDAGPAERTTTGTTRCPEHRVSSATDPPVDG